MTWNVGDEVVVDGVHLSGPFTIAAVSPRKIKLSNGTEWINASHARRWGTGRDPWTNSFLRRHDERTNARLNDQKRKDRATRLIRRLDRAYLDLTHEQMDAIEAAVQIGPAGDGR